jgi:hypothetical protein
MPRKGSKVGPFVFHVYLRELHGRWLVDSFMPAATFAPLGGPAKVRAAADFMAPAQGDSHVPSGPSRISSAYVVVPFAVLGLILASLLGWGIAAKVRDRRLMGTRRRSLPPLSMRPDAARARPGHRQ